MKTKISIVLAAMFLLTAFGGAAAEPAGSGYDPDKLFYLDTGDTSYQIYFPHYAGRRETMTWDVDGKPVEAEVLVMQYPEGEGQVLLFEVLTSDPDARYMTIHTKNARGMSAVADKEVNGPVGLYVSRLNFDAAFVNQPVSADIDVYDGDGGQLWHFFDIHFVFEERAAEPAIARPTTSKVVVNGKTVAFEAYVINGHNYFKLRDLAMAVNGTEKQFEVKWDGARNAIRLMSGEAYTPEGGELAVSDNPADRSATPTRSKVYVDGREMRFTAYTIGGNNYFKLRDVAKVFNIGVSWDGKANTIGLDTTQDYEG